MAGQMLSKSKILSGWQCHKRLWLELHEPDKAMETPSMRRAFAIGHEVGRVVMQLFPEGILIGPEDPDELPDLDSALGETRERLAGPGPLTLFEATLQHGGVLVRCDVLVRDALGDIRLVEVKASTKVKPVNYIDCAVQTWVLAGLGLHPVRVELAHIDNQFVYAGNGDYTSLFAFEDLTDRIAPMLENVPDWVHLYQGVVAGPMPPIDVGPQCRNPFDCPYLAHCRPEDPPYPTRLLPGGGKAVWQLLADGVEDIRDIPPGRLTSEIQERVRRVTVAGEPDLQPDAAALLGTLGWPRYFLDFETVSFPVPVWAGPRPYQALPFQWSCHVQRESGELRHGEWLAEGDGPPMRDFAETVIDALGDAGPVFVYTGFEARVLKELAERFSDLAEPLSAIDARLVDLHPIARASYYHPDMRGSWSIKKVLPTIAPDLDYAGLGDVQEGGAASEAFLALMEPDTPPGRRQALRSDLLRYCKLDTEALVRLRDFLAGAS